jgi:ferric-dicitrate binding protein FerR (iron transport regulator)
MMMDNEFRDLRPLDPREDPERWARMTASIARRAAPELARRRAAQPGLMMLLSTWARPAVSAAAGLAAAALAVLVLGATEPQADPTPDYALTLGYPTPVAQWMEHGITPSVEELMVSMEGVN